MGNPDGWGIALYPDGRAVQVIKEDIPAASSQLSRFLARYENLCSKIFVAHIRKASRGAVTYSNSHPFSRVVRGRDYVFAHNGTIRTFRGFRLGRFRPIGDTDSERLFCLILSFIKEKRTIEWNGDDLIEFRKFLVLINRMTGKDPRKPNKLNILLSDGETLIAYTDLYGSGRLHRLLLQEYGESLVDESDHSECRQFNDGCGKSIAVIATNPAPDDKRWITMEPGELCALRNGSVVFSSGKTVGP
jgi:predicted glutamine amidotransferase